MSVGFSGVGDADVRLIATDNSGADHPCKCNHLVNDAKAYIGDWSVDLPVAQIKQWQLQSRPFDQWIEIRNIAAQAGQGTQAQIVTSDNPGL
jgi:hypothetical protein